MRILQVIKTNRGAIWAFNQAKWLAEHGVEIITVLPNDSEGMAEKYLQNHMKIIESDWSLPVKCPLMLFSRIKKIKETINTIKPDIIHVHFVTNAIMIRIALKKDSTARLFQVPGPLHLETPFFNWIDRYLSTGVDYWAGACKKTCDYYYKKGVSRDHVFLAYYGTNIHECNSENKYINKLRNEYKITDDDIVVAMVSYYYKPKKYLGQKRGIKGHEDFIDAMSIVLEKHSNVKIVIIGNAWDGSEKYELFVQKYAKSKLNDKVIFTGYRDDIKEIYKEIDVVVHPSHSENLGGAAESLLLGVPTVATNIGGFTDIILHKETGYLVNVKSPKSIAEGVNWIIENYDDAKKMAENGKTRVTNLLNLDTTANNIMNIYDSILTSRKN